MRFSGVFFSIFSFSFFLISTKNTSLERGKIKVFSDINSNHWIIIFILLKILFFPLSNDAFFVEIGKIEEEKIEKITPEKLIIFTFETSN